MNMIVCRLYEDLLIQTKVQSLYVSLNPTLNLVVLL